VFLWLLELQRSRFSSYDGRLRKRIAVIKVRMNKRCSNDFGNMEIKFIVVATKIINVKETGFRDRRDVIRHGKS
jgi:hypothetical protein